MPLQAIETDRAAQGRKLALWLASLSFKDALWRTGYGIAQ